MTDTAVVPQDSTTTDAPPEPSQAEVDAKAVADAHVALNPCSVCGVTQDAGPEGVLHVFGHCWHCGYRPGQAVSAGTALAAPGLSAAQIDKIVGELRAGVVADILEAMRSGVVPSVTVQANTPEQVQAAVAQQPPAGDQSGGVGTSGGVA